MALLRRTCGLAEETRALAATIASAMLSRGDETKSATLPTCSSDNHMAAVAFATVTMRVTATGDPTVIQMYGFPLAWHCWDGISSLEYIVDPFALFGRCNDLPDTR